MRNAEEYTVSVRREYIEGEYLYVARVEELPDVEEYAESFEEARELALDTIRTTQEVFEKQGRTFPAPKPFVAPSTTGRVTLRLPKSVHAMCIEEAETEGVSLNTYILTCITSYRRPAPVGEENFYILNANELTSFVNNQRSWNPFSHLAPKKSGINVTYEAKGKIEQVSFAESTPELPLSCGEIASKYNKARFQNA